MADEGLRLAKLVQDIASRNNSEPIPIVTHADAVTIVAALHDEMDGATTARADQAASQGLEIACKFGCCGCCENTIVTTDPEAIAVADWLRQPENHEARAAFTSAYRRWRERVGNRVNKLAMYQAAGQPEDYEATLLQLWRERIMCAFNRDGGCTIYPVRPNVCRSCHALDTAAHCSADDPDGGHPTILEFPAIEDLRERVRPLLRSLHVAVRGDHIGPAPLCASVHRLLDQPRSQRGGKRGSTGDKIGRNSPCPCGSGRKYKKCCGAS